MLLGGCINVQVGEVGDFGPGGLRAPREGLIPTQGVAG